MLTSFLFSVSRVPFGNIFDHFGRNWDGNFAANISVGKGGYDVSTLQRNVLGATPILTVFYPVNNNKGNGNGNNENNGDNGLVSRTTAQLTCLQVSDLTTASNETMTPGENGDDDDSSAIQLIGGSQLAMWAALMTVVVVFWG